MKTSGRRHVTPGETFLENKILKWFGHCLRRERNHSGAISLRPTTCKTRPAGRVRPASRFCPAREVFLNYNGNRPAACHRPPLHHMYRPKLLTKHRLKTFVLNNVLFYCFDNAILNPRWIVNTDYQYSRCRREVTPTCISLTTTSGTRAIVHPIFDQTRDSSGAI